MNEFAFKGVFMKKIVVFCAVFCAAVARFAGAQQLSLPPDVEEQIVRVFKTLDGNFKSYPWAVRMSAAKSEEVRPARVVFHRTFADERNPRAGETDTIRIWAGSYRYDVILDFRTAKILGAQLSETVKMNLYTNILQDLYEGVYVKALETETVRGGRDAQNPQGAQEAAESGS